MKISLIASLVGIAAGIVLLCAFPQLLSASLEYTASVQGELGSSGVKGTPLSLAMGTAPLLLGVAGFSTGYLLEKLTKRVHNTPPN